MYLFEDDLIIKFLLLLFSMNWFPVQDIKSFSNHDLTLVGERGMTLSGGQKSRLALARAVYSDAQLVLMDDPLAAVDSRVAKHLFNRLAGYKIIKLSYLLYNAFHAYYVGVFITIFLIVDVF